MDIKELEKLIKLVEKSSISQLKLEEKGVKVEITKEETTVVQKTTQVEIPLAKEMVAPATPVQAPVAVPTVPAEDAPDMDNAVVSPMVGTYYAKPSPELPDFIKVGDRVKKGDVLFIIEAMKLFNEIEAENDGVVSQILVKNEEPVEFGQPILILNKDD